MPNQFLETFIGGEFTGPAISPAIDAPLVHTERCLACGGSGRFTSYRGRDCGPCFKCQGKGSRTFKTSSDTRAKARASAADRKASAADQARDSFKAAHPAEFAWLIDAAPRFDFAASMLEAIARYGDLTERQFAAVQSATVKAANRATERKAAAVAAPTCTAEPIEAAFSKARDAGLKRIKVRLGAFTFKPASSTSKNAGSIYVTTGGDYLGKITAGRFHKVSLCDAASEAAIIAACADPKAAAIAHGKATGECACCGRELTDPISIAAGIGPICASRFGF
jgi:hypothetical protein